ncbi:DNA topoisomerase I [Candidatus Woesearchaeota archaeon]|nr:DNA topoisomerase I [Candidatus Woesearchaeota archaeon]
MYQLIICEKPNAAKKIADALADNKATKRSTRDKVPYYELTHEGKRIVVACAVGHLYGLKQREGKKSEYPVFDIEWAPTADISKKSAFSRKYLFNIKRLAKDADSFIIATDYDIEGEVIGLNVVKYACKQKDAKRMKFSTLTKDDLTKAYNDASPHLDWPQANAGEARHKMDWFFGINLSRALTASIKSIGAFKLMSTGRVQGPALKLVVDKEKEIKAFKPVPYWEIQLNGEINKGIITALHELGKIFDSKKAEEIYKKCKGEKTAKVTKVEKKQFNSMPPVPFDLTSLQIEAHKCLGISPKNTLSTAQELYTGGYISYPRTSSQQLPKEIGYKKILTKLSRQEQYGKETAFLLKKASLAPNNGKKTDPAHPAIYPTGIIPKFKNDYSKRVYDLVVRRFFATFGDPATRETMVVNLDCNKENFIAKGTTTIEKGWFELYGRYVMLKEEELPPIKEGDICNIKKLDKLDKQTTPPKRYTEASLIKALEKENLGTKATRASIIETLYNRGFIDAKAIRATELGIRTEETLEKHSPKIVEPALTRHFEEEMEGIREGKYKPEEVIAESRKAVTDIVGEFNKHLKEIGEELLKANKETRNVMTYVGKCPNCKTGELYIRRGKFGQFISCNKYPDCKTLFSIPQNLVRPTKELCENCGMPKVQIIKKRKGPQIACINPKCPAKLKDYSPEKLKEMEDIESGKTVRKCPKCGEGTLKVRRSVYGSFIACDRYPKCRYTERLEEGK